MAPNPDLVREVRERFSEYPTSDDALLDECAVICEIYNVTPENLKFKYEALNYTPSNTRSEIRPLTKDSIAALKAGIQQSLRGNAGKPQMRAIAKSNTAIVDRSRLPPKMFKNTGVVQPGIVRVKSESISAIGTVALRSSTAHGVKFRCNATEPASVSDDGSDRYMYEKILERSEALDDRIDEFGELIRQHYNVADLGDPSSSTDEEIIVIGRITHDADSEGTAKLTETTMSLESSRILASGARVPLRLVPNVTIRGGPHGIGSAGFFPGAIVALKGKNAGTGSFLATEILSLPPLKPSSNPKQEMNIDSPPFSMYIACGPYTSDADLAYNPWRAFLKHVETTKPTVLLLIGPFVDAQHSRIKDGDIDTTPEDIFKSHFTEPLRIYVDSSPGSIVLIVPSTRDLISSQAVFPQAKLHLNHREPIFLLPNPCRFLIDDTTFGVSSVDTLYHIKKEEYIKRGIEVDSIPRASASDAGNDPMGNLCRHLLQQRSFYPLFPPPLDVSHEVNLSVTRSNGLKLGDDAPDVLILPSRLKQFSKTVDSTTAVNPGFLTKGSYAVLNFASRDAPGPVAERISTEIARLEP